jgi:5-formyltetrahydrofolate cyclo-ligase
MPDAGHFASPHCLAGAITPDDLDLLAVDAEPARDVARRRKARRAALAVTQRHTAAGTIALHLETLLAARSKAVEGLALSASRLIRAERNLRHRLESLLARGTRVALPVVVTPAAPPTFRLWSPESKMVQGFWEIPVPAHAPKGVHDVTLAPVVGWDAAGFRLGNGAGFFDRTLAALMRHPFGIGLQSARLATIFPQPYSIAQDVILTEAGIPFEREGA